MSKIVKVHYLAPAPGMPGHDVVAMPALCVACGSAAGEGRQMKASSSGANKISMNLSFPLCNSCYEVLATAGAKPESGRYKMALFVPKDARANYRKIRHSVRLSPGHDFVRYTFTNDTFGNAFEQLHATELSWAEKRRYEKQRGGQRS